MSFSASSVHTAATMALVDGIAGMMFLVTPCVSWYVTPCIRFRFDAQGAAKWLEISARFAHTSSTPECIASASKAEVLPWQAMASAEGVDSMPKYPACAPPHQIVKLTYVLANGVLKNPAWMPNCSARASARSYTQRMCSSVSASKSSPARCAVQAISLAHSMQCAGDLH